MANKPLSKVRSAYFYATPPAAGFASPLAIFNAWTAVRQTLKDAGQSFTAIEDYVGVVEDCLRRQFGCKDALLFGSGKEALGSLFSQIERRRGKKYIAMGAYTCPDIASAVLRAGLEVLPLDINPLTLEPRIDELSKVPFDSIAAVVLSNLYGLPDEISQWRNVCSENKWILVDDACQSSFSRRDNEVVGMREGVYGVTSFGRGKTFCGLGGGALLLPHSKLAREIKDEYAFDVRGERLVRTVVDFVKATLFWVFQHPRAYWLPTLLPFFKLGETNCDPYYIERSISKPELLSVVAQLRAVELRAERIVKEAATWHKELSEFQVIEPFVERGFSFDGSVVPLRYTVLIDSSSKRDAVLRELLTEGLGASMSYPKSILEFDELKGHMFMNDCPNAALVAERIITLPVHCGVTARDHTRTIKILRNHL